MERHDLGSLKAIIAQCEVEKLLNGRCNESLLQEAKIALEEKQARCGIKRDEKSKSPYFV